MKAELFKLLQAHSGNNNGILIPIPIDEYVDKIFNCATILPYLFVGELKGFIAYYNNDESKRKAFLTMILVDKGFQGRGLGKRLLEFSINDVSQSGFEFYGLEVLKDNENAIALYTKFGFEKKEDRGELWYMEKTLR